MSKSPGGTSTSSTQIPAYLEDAVRENINRARDVSQIGYVPYYGPDVAAFSPMQQQSMRSTGNAASAFGLAPQGFDGTAGIPQAQTFAGGVQGYSSAPLYEQSLDNLFANAPAQYRAMSDMFVDPFTGARSRNDYGNASPVMGMARPSGNGNSPYGNDANMAHLARTNNLNSEPDYQPSTNGGTGYYSGGEKTGMQTNLMTGDEYEAYVLAHGLPPEGDTFMDGVRGFGRSFVNNGLLGSLYESATGNPIMQRDIDPSDPNYYPTMSGNESSFYPVGGNYDQYAQSRIAVQEAQQAQLRANRREADQQVSQQQMADDLIYDMMLFDDQGNSPSVSGGLMGAMTSSYPSNNIVDLSAARRAEDLAAPARREAARVEAARVEAARVEAARVEAAAAKKAVDASRSKREAANRAAAKKAAAAKKEAAARATAQKNTVNGGGDGAGQRQRDAAQASSKSQNRRQQSQLNLV